MSTSTHLNILDSSLIKLIEYGDQVNRELGRFLKTLSRFVVGIILLIFLIPVAIILVSLTTIVARISILYIAFTLKNALKKVQKTDERELMESLIKLEELNTLMSGIPKGLNATKLRKGYFTIFFGDSWNKCIKRGNQLQKTIEEKVYPNINSEPTEEQIQRLLKEYQGLPIN